MLLSTGGYNPTPTLAGSSNGNTSKPNPKRQAVNGAGGKAGGKPIKRQKASPIEEQDADGDYASEAEGEGDAPDKDRDGEVVPTQRNATRKEPIKVNGKKLTGAMKGKGKAKVADPSPKPNGTTNPRSKKDKDVDVLEVDDDDEEDGAEEDIDQPSGKNTARKSNNTTVSSSVSTRQMEKLKKHNEEVSWCYLPSETDGILHVFSCKHICKNCKGKWKNAFGYEIQKLKS